MVAQANACAILVQKIIMLPAHLLGVCVAKLRQPELAGHKDLIAGNARVTHSPATMEVASLPQVNVCVLCAP